MDHEFSISIGQFGGLSCCDCDDFIMLFDTGDFLGALNNAAEAHKCEK